MTTAVDTRIPAEGAAAAGPPAPRTGRRRRLFAKYAATLVGLVSLVLLINGSVNVWFAYGEARDAAIRLQSEKATAAAQRIEEYIAEIEKQIGWTTATQWASAPIEQRRFDYGRLLRQVPGITELIQLDNHGREQLKVSRLAMDVVGSGTDYSGDPRFVETQGKKMWFGPVYFRKESEPYMTMAVAHSGRHAGVTVAEVNLKLIWDVITAIKIGKTGYAYVVDDKGRLIAHPDISRVLRNTDLSGLPQVEAARGTSAGAAAEPDAIVRNLDGRRVLSASAAIPKLGWLVFVEQPLSEALAPLYTSLLQTGLLLVLGLAVAVLAGLLLARRMTGPIRELDTGAARIGAGVLGHRIQVHTGDELEELAERFNTMAGDLQSSYADLEKKVEDRTAELTEALDRQTATAEVLGIISSSPGRLEPVFEAMLANAVRICDGSFGMLALYDGGVFRGVAGHGVGVNYPETLSRLQHPPPGTTLARLEQTRQTAQLADTAAEPAYDPVRALNPEFANVRTNIAVPLLKEGDLIGAIVIFRDHVRLFNEKEVQLVENFAAQAVIAIENARLITETREALEQQTATAEVLGVINSSPGDLAPVFDAMLDKAMRLCGAVHGTLTAYDGEHFRCVASHNLPQALFELLSQPRRAAPNSPQERLLRGERIVHIADMAEVNMAASPDDQVARAAAEIGFTRTVLFVPLRKDNTLLGYIGAQRHVVRPFTDKQIALLENFAAQAVIAMENARLITETREALEQQTATAEVLGVINSSPGDLAPVFDAMLEKALHLCDAASGLMWTFDGERAHVGASRDVPAEFLDYLKREPPGAGPDTFFGRAILTRSRIHAADIAAEEPYRRGVPLPVAAVELGGIHAALFVPLIKDAAIPGIFSIFRKEARPFTDKQIALLQNFAAQAVIAMENARLITETREALEQQTATAEVLGVINSSPGELAPVFDAILDKAHSLCGAACGSLHIADGDRFRAVAVRGVSSPFANLLRQPIRPGPNHPVWRAIAGEPFVQILDVSEIDDQRLRDAATLDGFRTVLLVPLRKEELFLGYIIASRQEVRPFSDKQIALLQNFAAQAVIAMENARLITETREALEQQTATAEVLGVINSSPGDLTPVWDAMLEKATRLCEAASGILWTYDGTRFRAAAQHGLPYDLIGETQDPNWRPTASLEAIAAGQDLVRDDDLSKNRGAERVVAEGGMRTGFLVALRKGNSLLGAIRIFRREARPFTDKQIALVQNFAAQAVIAMENARLITETQEALEQQTATAEVLGVINSSPGDLVPVFEAMLDKAMRLCTAAFGYLMTYDGERFQEVAHQGLPPRFAEYLPRLDQPSSSGAYARIKGGAPLVHIADLMEGDVYRTSPLRQALVDLGGARTGIVVALRKDETLLGVLTIYRQEVRLFSDKQVALLQSFAAQAVIAMENARLITETREALEQQTATAEVLGVINSSPGDLAPVFDAMLDKAIRLCEATHGHLFTYDGDRYHLAAARGEPRYIDWTRQVGPLQPHPDTPLGRIKQGEVIVHVADIREEEVYRIVPMFRDSIELRGVYSQITVALVKDNILLGAMNLYRQEVRPFSDKQIALVQNFAAQAVIAMENARLLTETREALEYQTATSDVLKVISRSTFDLQPVLETVAETAARLCEADTAVIARRYGEVYRAAAEFGVTPEFAAFIEGHSIAPSRGSIVGRVVMQGGTVQIADVTADPEYTLPETGGGRTLLGVPLLRENEPIGVVVLGRQRVEPFNEKQVALVTTFADQAVIAMENARLLGELRGRTHDLQESLEYQTATSDVLRVISRSTFDLGPVLENVIETALRLCRAKMGSIFRLEHGAYRWAVGHGLEPAYEEIERRTPILPGPGTLVGRAAMEGGAIHVADAEADVLYVPKDDARIGRVRTMLGVPLLREGVPIGVIAMARDRVEPFTDKQIELVRTFADQAVIAIENARLFNELHARTAELGRSVDELKMLSEVGQAVSSTLDLRAVLSTILTRSVGLIGAEAGVIFRYSRAERAFRFVEAVGYTEAMVHEVSELSIPENTTGMGEAIARRAPVQIPDLRERAPNPLRDLALADGYRSVLIVPLVGADRIMGATILQRRATGEFPPETVRLMQTLASQSVLAIQNARLFREIADKSEQLALASQHKSQFLANMSHELRTPLNAILGYAELLVDGIYGVLPDRPKGVLERIQNNGRHLLALINDVLDLAKIEAGQLTLTLEDYALPEVVRSVVSATEPLATAKGLKFTAAVQDNMPMAHGDARRVSQVLLNLVGNAIKFTDAGEVEIRAAAANGQFELTVRDTGPGIADADQDRIFGEFQQIDNSNTRQKGGTGLGLAISRRMVEMQGGTIAVESVLGQGSTFRVVLPVHVDEMMEAAE